MSGERKKITLFQWRCRFACSPLPERARRVSLRPLVATAVAGVLTVAPLATSSPSAATPLSRTADPLAARSVAPTATSAPGTIDRVAGLGLTAAATAPFFLDLTALFVEPAGTVLVSDGRRVLRLSGTTITLLGGTGESTTDFFGDGGIAYGSPFGRITDVVSDANGNVYVADSLQSRVRRITNGQVDLVAGTGAADFSGDGDKAVSASINRPGGLAVDGVGNLYIADVGNNLVRRVDRAGIITTVAGTGVAGFSGDGGPATAATLSGPTHLGVDPSGRVLLFDVGNGRIRRFTPGGTIETIAGGGTQPVSNGASANTVSLTNATFTHSGVPSVWSDADPCTYFCTFELKDAGVFLQTGSYPSNDLPILPPIPSAFALDDSGLPYAAFDNQSGGHQETNYYFVARGTPADHLALAAGRTSLPLESGPEPALTFPMTDPDQLAVTPTGRFYVRTVLPDEALGVDQIDETGLVSSIVGPIAEFKQLGIATAPDGSLIRAGVQFGFGVNVVRTTNSGDSVIATEMFNFPQDPLPCGKHLGYPEQIAASDAGIVYYDSQGRCINRLLADGTTQLIASTATLGSVDSLAELPNGDVLIADSTSARVWRLTADGTYHVFAGTGDYHSTGDEGPATAAGLSGPTGVAVDKTGNVYIADPYGPRIRVVIPSGTIETLAGHDLDSVYEGDGGDARSAGFPFAAKVGVDGAGNVYVLDKAIGTVRRIVPYAAVPSGASRFVPVAPTRLMDTRSGFKTRSGSVAAGSSVELAVAGIGVVPPTATAVVLNVTATNAAAAGFVQVLPTGRAAFGSSSSLNINKAGETVPNLVIAPIGNGGDVTFYSQSGTDLVVDLFGFYEPIDVDVRGGRFVGTAPTRVLDTRRDVDHKPAAGESLDLQISGVGPVPAQGVSAVVLNVTITEPSAPGFVQVIPTGGATPLGASSNLNAVAAGQTAANLVFVPLGTDGKITFFTQSGTQLVADVMGYVTSSDAPASGAGLFVPVPPARWLDTRRSPPMPGPGGTASIGLPGPPGLPTTGMSGYYLNVTATNAAAPGYIQALPTGSGVFGASSNLNVDYAGQTRANATVVAAGEGGSVTFYVFAGADIVVDTAGWYTS
jgi:sugar lactone lactonase YvrE